MVAFATILTAAIVSAALGYAITGTALGAVLGAALALWVGQNLRQTDKLRHPHLQKRGTRENREQSAHKRPGQKLSRDELFFIAFGLLAKSSGRVRKHHVQWTERLMVTYKLSSAERKIAIRRFEQGRDMSPSHVLRMLSDKLPVGVEDRSLLLNLCAEMAQSNGETSKGEVATLRSLAHVLGLSSRLNDIAPCTRRGARNPKACRYLGVPVTATDDELKLAYRRLLQRTHPDRLPIDADAATKRKANEETMTLRQNYELALGRSAAKT